MNYFIDETVGLKKTLQVTIPNKDININIDKKVKELQSTISIPGFRNGKVPPNIIMKRHGDSIKQESTQEIIQEAISSIINELKISLVGYPDFSNYKTDKDNLTFSVTLEETPKIDLLDVSTLKLNKFSCDINEKDIDNSILSLQKQKSTWIATDKKSKNGNKVNINFKGTVDGEEFKGGSAEKFDIVLGEGRMLQDFEDGIIGLSKGESSDVMVKFPENYSEGLSGKNANFNIYINEVLQQQLPEVNEEFIRNCQIESGNIADLKDKASKFLQQQANEKTKKLIKEELVNKIIAMHEFELPMGMIEKEKQGLTKQYSNFYNENNKKEIDENLQKEAENRIKLSLILSEYIKKYKIVPDEKKTQETIIKYATSTNNPSKTLEEVMSNSGKIKNFEHMAMEELLFDKLLSIVSYENSKLGYNEIIAK